MKDCKKSVTPKVNEDFKPSDYIYTTEVVEEDTKKTQHEINDELRKEIISLKKMITLLDRKIDG